MAPDSALVDAAFDGDLAEVKRLLKAGHRLESVNVAGETALCNAALSGNFALVKFLIERGANARHVSKRFKTNALHYAVQNDAPDIVDLLLASGTSASQKDLFGQTPLDVALKHRHARVIVRLPGGVAPVRKPQPVKAGRPKKNVGALGVWGLPLGEWVSKSANTTLSGACGGAAQLYPWQGDELVDCFAGQRESVNSNSENLLRYAFSLPR